MGHAAGQLERNGQADNRSLSSAAWSVDKVKSKRRLNSRSTSDLHGMPFGGIRNLCELLTSTSPISFTNSISAIQHRDGSERMSALRKSDSCGAGGRSI